mgnify:CR=1 FL=1
MNLKYAFYKGYYDQFDPCRFEDKPRKKAVEDYNKNVFEDKNKKLTDYIVNEEFLKPIIPNKTQYGNQLETFNLVTIYPGLFSGSGYTHETGSKGELMLGFFFDHTSGLPILPGHSVKGVLRSAFPRYDAPRTTEAQEIKLSKIHYVLSLLQLPALDISDKRKWVDKLEKQIFEGINPNWDGKDPKIKYLSMGKHDVFLDTVISKPGVGGKILGVDAITPHGDNPLKEPIPLPFIKVLPGVTWQFSFLLHDTTIDGIEIKAEQKRKLFEAILLDLGIGAKMNVGYGQLLAEEKYMELFNAELNNHRATVSPKPEGKPEKPSPPKPSFQPPSRQFPNQYYFSGIPKNGDDLHGVILPPPKNHPDAKRIQFLTQSDGMLNNKRDAALNGYPDGTVVTVRVMMDKNNQVSAISNIRLVTKS